MRFCVSVFGFPSRAPGDKTEGCSRVSTVILCCNYCTFLTAEATRNVGPSLYLKQKDMIQ
jgi:hypothetical protein